MGNAESNFAKLIKEILEEEKIEYRLLSGGWVFQLNKKHVTQYIFGYQFGLNSDTAQAICSDKCTAAEVMALSGIPHVEHFYYMTPAKLKFADPHGNWESILNAYRKYGKLVLKNNTGTGGDEVYFVSNRLELEYIAQKILDSAPALAVSPYIPYEKEYRIIVLKQSVKLIYSKIRPCLTGDGKSTVKELYCGYLSGHNGEFQALLPAVDLNLIPKEGETYVLNWKHNLGQGAAAMPVTDPAITKPLSELALKAARAVRAGFVSVDIIEYKGAFMVMEINGGVMMENLSGENTEHRNAAKSIYREAVLTMMGEQA